jgi:nucleotide-binding universal stress UspA family protein
VSTNETSRIVVGYDGSPWSDKAVKWAARQAELTGSTLEVLVAWEWPMAYGAPVPLPEGFDPEADARNIAEAAGRIVAAEHPGVHTRLLTRQGHPAPILVEASKDADLLVVGSRGHGEFVGMLIGSVSEHCVTNATCPVLVIRDL